MAKAVSQRWKSIMQKAIIVVTIMITALLVFSKLSSRVTSNLDSYTYNLPFKSGEKYKVVQGYGGLFSHRHIAAIDFDMPEGTPVYAARDGIIYKFKDDSNEGGPFSGYEKKANFIIVQHNNGSFGCYWHLKKNGVVVKSGLVAKGQLIGYSGSTGFVLMPHLHFSVKRKLEYEPDAYVQTKFKTTNGAAFLMNGAWYERPKK